MQNAKAKLIAKYGDEVVSFDVMFNPSEYSYAITNSSNKKFNQKSKSKVQNMGNSQSNLTMKLVFDSYEEKEPVTKYTDILEDMIIPKYRGNKLIQPVLTFCWGDMVVSGVMKSITISYTMFMENGKPVRANTSISIIKSDADPAEKES